MPAPVRSRRLENIWVAAGDGDLDRVRDLMEHQSMSPNVQDNFSYTPMHAAASYGQLEMLEYLITRGGDVNITDADGDTPLYTVENVETARFLVEHGAVVHRVNAEGVSPADHLQEDFPNVAEYLQSLSSTSTSQNPTQGTAHSNQPSQHQQESASEQLASSLLASVQDIMERAEAEGRDPDEELRHAVSRVVVDGVITGFDMTTDTGSTERDQRHHTDGPTTKRPKTDG